MSEFKPQPREDYDSASQLVGERLDDLLAGSMQIDEIKKEASFVIPADRQAYVLEALQSLGNLLPKVGEEFPLPYDSDSGKKFMVTRDPEVIYLTADEMTLSDDKESRSQRSLALNLIYFDPAAEEEGITVGDTAELTLRLVEGETFIRREYRTAGLPGYYGGESFKLSAKDIAEFVDSATIFISHQENEFMQKVVYVDILKGEEYFYNPEDGTFVSKNHKTMPAQNPGNEPSELFDTFEIRLREVE